MDQVSNLSLEEIASSNWIRPYRLHYSQNGVQKTWDLSVGRPSIFVVAFNKSSKTLVMVKQLRPALLVGALRKTAKDGQLLGDLGGVNVADEAVTLEFCAGIVDKPDKSFAEIAKAEMWEECGYEVDLEHLEEVQTFPASVGTRCEPMIMFYTEVTDAMRKGSGGGLEHEGELIEVVDLSIDEARKILAAKEVKCPPWTLYGLMWFVALKLPTL